MPYRSRPEAEEEPSRRDTAQRVRMIERTLSFRELYCDDLVTDEALRSTGVGHALMEHMAKLARERGCDLFTLDSGTQRQQAHRFYFREGMTITSFHFSRKP